MLDKLLAAGDSWHAFIWGFVLLSALLIAAHIWNPDEASFQAHLTEKLFEYHLRRLHSSITPNDSTVKPIHSHPLLALRVSNAESSSAPGSPMLSTSEDWSQNTQSSASHRSSNSSPVFPAHITNKTAVHVRPPSFILRSFGVFSVAVASSPITLPEQSIKPGISSPKLNDQQQNTSPDSMEDPPINIWSEVTGQWYIGILGSWWYGGFLPSFKFQSVYQSSFTPEVSPTESVSNSDIAKDYTSKSTKKYVEKHAPHSPIKVSTIKNHSPNGKDNRNRNDNLTDTLSSLMTSKDSTLNDASKDPKNITITEDSRSEIVWPAEEADDLQDFSPSPPPYSARLKPDNSDLNHKEGGDSDFDSYSGNRTRTSGVCNNNIHSEADTPNNSLLKQQLKSLELSTRDLRSQIEKSQSSLNSSMQASKNVLLELKNRKIQEDTARHDLKNKTKTLEDHKRVVEAQQRESDRDLRSALDAKISLLDSIKNMKTEMEAKVKQSADSKENMIISNNTVQHERERILIEIAQRKSEISSAENVVQVLGDRLRNYEDQLTEETAVAFKLREERDIKLQIFKTHSYHQNSQFQTSDFARDFMTPPISMQTSYADQRPSIALRRSTFRPVPLMSNSQLTINSHVKKGTHNHALMADGTNQIISPLVTANLLPSNLFSDMTPITPNMPDLQPDDYHTNFAPFGNDQPSRQVGAGESQRSTTTVGSIAPQKYVDLLNPDAKSFDSFSKPEKESSKFVSSMRSFATSPDRRNTLFSRNTSSYITPKSTSSAPTSPNIGSL